MKAKLYAYNLQNSVLCLWRCGAIRSVKSTIEFKVNVFLPYHKVVYHD